MRRPHGCYIRLRLLEKGVSLAQIARSCKIKSRSAVSQVLTGSARSYRIECEIAKVLDAPWEKLFPPLCRKPRSRTARGQSSAA